MLRNINIFWKCVVIVEKKKIYYNLSFDYGTIPTCLVAIETFCFSDSF